jgi:hypothetical protein
MNEISKQLEALQRKTVILEFEDGDVVDARLLAVDTSDHDDVVLEITNVRKSPTGRSYSPRDYYRAAISTIRSVRSVGEGGAETLGSG